MYKREEKKLTEYKHSYDDIKIPLDSLDEAILTGFQKAKAEEVRKPRNRKMLFSFMAAAILFFGFFTSIKLSPAFASYVADIPGMEKIIELIRGDKGRMQAIENSYYQEIGVSQEKNGVEISIDGAIADENGLVLFYSIESAEKQKEVILEEVGLFNQNGQKLNWSSASIGSHHTSEEGETAYNGSLEYFFDSPPHQKDFEIKLKIKSDQQTADYRLSFSLNKDVKTKKTYKINKTVTIEGQKITFAEADVYPLRVAVHVKMDPANSKKLLNFDDIRLVDENGEVWNKINNGVIASRISENEAIIYLQSNYFNNPEKLYLEVNKIQAVDKSEAFVVVDTEKEQLLTKPSGNQLYDFELQEDYLMFKLQTEEEFNYFLFGGITDGNGAEVTPKQTENLGTEGEVELRVNIPDLKKVKSPISLELSFFPSWIEGDEKVRIK
ncbi:DUF4179 domain-containing protein [Neobacillus sp. YX16]|uniref:DUF4179 domain-containing protein n=1 Tax=Neobacillus sp. YX16 TaxID=3047874 RepID=UPI0024C40ADF|nr:DUF4179 domain-containing protein [Neobacillus sp. YX16]WHZ03875.1 DUF4179 domain-containing protein [Neobacillus sp. YX16]